jgi:hypothetical protein
MKDNKDIIQQVSNVVDDGYKRNVNTSAGVKVFSLHLTYIHSLGALNLGFKYVCVLTSIVCLLIFILPYHAIGADKNQPFQFTKNQQIQQIKPKKPVRIKLHRNAKGEYSWDLTGDNVDEVVQTDRRLRKLLKVE